MTRQPVPVRPVSVEERQSAAQRMRVAATADFAQLRSLLRAVETLFGAATASVLADTAERAHEHFDEACHEYDDALTATTGTARAERDAHGEVRSLLADAVLDAAGRAKKGRREPPDWVPAAVDALQIDWLHPADDPRHRHDTDAGGNCRGPWCTHHSDYDEEPF